MITSPQSPACGGVRFVDLSLFLCCFYVIIYEGHTLKIRYLTTSDHIPSLKAAAKAFRGIRDVKFAILVY